MDDEDAFLYGDSLPAVVQPEQKNLKIEVHDFLLEPEEPANAISDITEEELVKTETNGDLHAEENGVEAEGGEEEEDEEEEDIEESDDDIEIILEPPSRSLDFRAPRGGKPAAPSRSFSGNGPPTNHATNLTTEYTPRERGAPVEPPKQPPTHLSSQSQDDLSRSVSAGPQGIAMQPTAAQQPPTDDGFDPSTLPPARAPPSHPEIDPTVPGVFEGRSIFDIDMTNIADKPWRRPGSDISDWFNYGFDEISWEAYCYRRRDMGELASVLKANVINFAGMPEEQVLALPPEVRTMVMTGTNAMMGVAAAGGPGGPVPGPVVGPGMMPPGVPVGMNPMNPMMADMSQMGGMGVGGPMGMPMGIPMNAEMGVGMPGAGPGGPMMQDGMSPGMSQGQSGGIPLGAPGQSVTPEPGVQMNLQDGYAGQQAMLNANSGGEFSLPDSGAQYNNGDGLATPVPVGPGRGTPPTGPYRGRGIVLRGIRGAGFAGRGRGAVAQQLPLRPASPLPPNVPTGPRNPGNRYKDRDNNAQAVDGLDYGGGKDGGNPPLGDLDDKLSRKRRSPPTNDDDRMGRSSKRR